MRVALVVVTTALALGAGAAWAGAAHEHGVARLAIAVEDGTVVVDLDSPLDNLLGFEHAARNDAERRAADALVKRLNDGAALFRFDAAARCRIASLDLRSAVLRLGPASTAPADAEHADVAASYRFDCQRVPVSLEHGLFDAFARLQRVEVQSASAKRQAKATLNRPARRIALGA